MFLFPKKNEDGAARVKRLAIIASHPIQYYAPWFRVLAARADLEIRVFYLWDFGVRKQIDPKFSKSFSWDIPLLEGYAHEWIPNTSHDPGTHHFNGLNNPSLFKCLSEWNPQAVLFTTLFYREPLKTLFRLKTRNIPCFFRGDSHLLTRQPSSMAIPNLTKRLIFSFFKGFLYVGSANRDYFRAFGVKDSKLFHCPHSIDNDRFSELTPEQNSWLKSTRQELDLDSASCTFLFVGKFEGKKRPGIISECFSKIKNPNVRLLFVGDGILKPDLEAMALDDPRIKLLPFQNQSMMPAVYRLGNCLVLPSYGPQETWGLCVNEAMASGLPAIVSSHVGCAPDLIQHKKTGWIFNADQPEDLLEIMEQLANHPHSLTSVSSAAQKHIQNYSYDSATRGLMQALTIL